MGAARTPENEHEPTLVVGVGASAGGLSAVQALLRATPPGAGLSLIVVFHLDPSARSLLPDVLVKHSALPVLEAVHGAPLARDHVYTAPAHSVVTVHDGLFQLIPLETVPERRTPIDRALQSIGAACAGRAAAVILSGAGSDGALGLKAVADAGGVTFVQDPATAQHDSMPQSAIGTGAADYILPPEAIGGELIAYAAHVADARRDDAVQQREIADVLPSLCDLLLDATGHNFRHYKTSTLVRRVLRRTQVLRLPSATAYLERVRSNKTEAAQLFNDLLINVTAFFRDPDAFATLAREVLPRLFAERQPDQPIRMWCAGCATGEEAYTLAMLVREQLDTLPGPPPDVQIFATDIDQDALAFARQGVYPIGVADEIGEARLKRFFLKKGQQYHVVKELRELVLFSVHNLINDPPFSRLDLISCRNLLIYLGTHLQKKLIPLFHYALKPGGFLFLGPSENLSSHRELFRPVDAKHRLSRRLPTAIRPPGLLTGRSGPLTPVRPTASAPAGEHDTYLLMQRIILDEFAPKAVVVNEEGQLVSASGNLEKYLSVSSGNFHNSLTRLVRDGLRVGVRAAFAEAVTHRRKVVNDGLFLRIEGGVQRVMITVQPMPQMGEDSGLFLVVFQDIGLPIARDAADKAPPSEEAAALIDQLERELTTTREDLERTVQDLEAANEELKSGNEELLSMNEELQSANEELETSKEEVQAANDSLVRLNTDLENLLTSTQIATLFLDRGGNIRRVTPAASSVYRVRPDDAGRPLEDFTHRAKFMPPLPPFAAVRDAPRPIEDLVDLLDGGHLLRRVVPYLTPEGAVEGVVVTFTDVTEQRRATEALRVSEARERQRARELETVLDAVPAIVWTTWTRDAREVKGNRTAAELLRLPPGVNQSKTAPSGEAPTHFEVHHAGRPIAPADLPLQRAARGEEVRDCEVELVFDDGARLHLLGNTAPLRDGDGGVYGAVAAFLDVTARKRAEDAMRESEQRFRLLADTCPLMIWVTGPDGALEFLNRAHRRFFGWADDEAGTFDWRARIHLDDAVRYLEAFDAALRQRAPFSDRARFRRADGAWRWIESYSNPRSASSGEFLGVVGSGLDVTDRVHAEEALRASEEHYRHSVELNPQIPWTADADGNITDFNHRWLELTGMTHEEALGGGWIRAPHPEDRPRMQAAWSRSIATGEPYDVEHRVRTAAGEFRWMRSRATARRDADGRIVRWYGTTEDIDDRVRAEAERVLADRALLQATAVLNAVGESTPALIAVKDLEGRYLLSNPATLAVHGRPLAEVLGRDDLELLGPEIGAPIMAHDRQVMSAGRAESFEERAVGRLFQVTKSPYRDERGAIVGIVAVGTDITDLKRAEQAARASEARLRFVMNAIPQKIFTTTPTGDVDDCNLGWLAYTGQPLEHLCGRRWLRQLHPDDVAESARAWEASLAGGEPYQSQHRFVRGDGEFRWHLSRAVPMRDDDGGIVMWVGTSTDIHDLKSAEEAAHRRAEEAEEARRILDGIMAYVPEGITVAYAPDVTIRMVSRHGLQLIDRPPDTLTGIPDAAHPATWGIYHRDSVTLAAPEELPLTRAVRRAEVVIDEEWMVRRADGSLVPILCNAGPIRGPAGDVVGGVIAYRDISAIKRIEGDLRELNRRKDEFLATLAHELRNPLAPLLSSLAVLRLSGTLDSHRQLIELMERQLGHLVHLVDDLLDVSRVTSGKINLRVERLELREVIDAAAEMCRPGLARAGHRFERRVPDQPLPLDGDRTRLVQILTNVLGNACKYTPNGGHIELTAERDGPDVVVRITDTGIGIPPDMLPRVFDVFTQVGRSLDRSQGGLGLGLALVHKLVEMHGGTVWAESRGLGLGSTFVVRLPLAAGPIERTARLSRDGEPAPAPRGLRVLVVDDNRDAADSLDLLLQFLGNETATAYSGPEALDLARRFRPHLVLLDIGLPGMTGYEVAARLRDDPTVAGAVIVALTGWGTAEDRSRSREAGFDHHMTKPIDADQLAELLERMR